MLISSVRETFSKNHLRMLLDRGFRVTLMGNEKTQPTISDHPNCRYILYPFYFMKSSRFSVITRWTARLRQGILRAVWWLLKPDIVHVQEIDFRANDCVQASLRPLVLTTWGSDVNDLFLTENVSKVRTKQLIEAIASADYITADTVDLLNKCELLAGRKHNSVLLYFGVDMDRFKPGYKAEAERLKEVLGISPNKRVILSARLLKPKYGHHLVMDAFARVLSDPAYSNLCLILKRRFHQSHEYEDQLRKQAERLGIAGHIVWIDTVPDEDMPVLYALADVVVNYPDTDGFPITFLEAAACKRPMVSCRLPAYEEVFPPKTFWMVPPNDTAELCDAIKIVLDADPGEVQDRVDKAYEKAITIGSKENCAQAWIDFYVTVLRGIQVSGSGRK